MPAEVNAVDGHFNGVEQSPQNWLRQAGDCQHSAVVVRIAGAMEQPCAVRLNCCRQFVDDVRAAALGKVGDCFDEMVCVHRLNCDYSVRPRSHFTSKRMVKAVAIRTTDKARATSRSTSKPI